MVGQNYYLITALPPLGELGSEPAMTQSQFLEHVGEESSARKSIESLFLSDDLLQRDSFLAGQIDQPRPAVLTDKQIRNEQPLPEDLLSAQEIEPQSQVGPDQLWEAYFRHACDVAGQTHNEFLGEWVAYEVGLRNALAWRRAEKLGLEPVDYLLATDLGSDEDFALVVNEWSAAPNPLAGAQVLDRARWNWIGQHDRWFSFADDELAGYAARLMLVVRWDRLSADRA